MATLEKGIKAIEKRGMLLVYPINNAPEPPSLWSEFYPKSKMRWEWDSGGDNRVAGLWHLREELSRSKKVVYAKWYKGRATFFSKGVFAHLYSVLARPASLSQEAKTLLGLLMEDSPVSTKILKKRAKSEFGFEEKSFEKSMKELWKGLLIVGFGEVDDGAFPSLAVGATEVLFEELTRSKKEYSEALNEKIKEGGLFHKEILQVIKRAPAARPTKSTRKVIRGKDLQVSS